MFLRQLYDLQTGTYTYLLADKDSGEAVLIDPVYEQAMRDEALLNELGLKLLYTLETHIHADHITSAWLLHKKMGSKIALSSQAGAEGMHRLLAHGDKIKFGKHFLMVMSTPGHTKSCLTFVLETKKIAFTGDCLLIRGCGRTDFQGGDAAQMYRSIQSHIFTLPEDCLLYPGHDYKGLTSTCVAEEKFFNPRLGGQLSEQDFVGFMDNLGLDHPKKIDIAVPGNLKCGRPDEDINNFSQPAWAELTLTFAGFWEVQPHWLAENLDVAQILDVREKKEFNGKLGHVKGAIPIALGYLESRVDELDKQRPIITICRAGGRSAQATVILHKAGFNDVANLAGGMLNWNAQQYPIHFGDY